MKSNVMCVGSLWNGYPDDFVVANINGYFIQYSCTVMLVGVPFAVRFGPAFIDFTINTVHSAQVCFL